MWQQSFEIKREEPDLLFEDECGMISLPLVPFNLLGLFMAGDRNLQ